MNGPAARGPFPGGPGGCAKDTAVLYRKKIAAEEAHQKRLLQEHGELLRRLGGAAPGSPPGGRAGCSEPSGEGGALGGERMVLLSSFQQTAPVAGIAVNSQDIVVTARWDGTARLFDLPNWREVGQLDVAGARQGPAGDSDGGGAAAEAALVAAAFMPIAPQMLGIASGQRVQLWERGDGKGEHKADYEHPAPVGGLDFHPSQDMLCSVADDGRALLWDVTERRELRCLPCGGSELSACRFLGGSGFYQFLVAVAGLDGTVGVWDMRRRQPVMLHRADGADAATCLDCHAGSHLLVAGSQDGTVAPRDLRTWRELQSVDVHSHLGALAYPRSLAVSPCGTLLAVGCMDGELLVLDLRRQCRALKALHHSETISAMAWGRGVRWAPTPHFLACASLDGSWSCWAHGGRALAEEA